MFQFNLREYLKWINNQRKLKYWSFSSHPTSMNLTTIKLSLLKICINTWLLTRPHSELVWKGRFRISAILQLNNLLFRSKEKVHLNKILLNINLNSITINWRTTDLLFCAATTPFFTLTFTTTTRNSWKCWRRWLTIDTRP